MSGNLEPTRVTDVQTPGGEVIQSAAPGSVAPGGSDTQVQFNDGGVFGGNSGFTFNKSLVRLTVTNRVISQRLESTVGSGTAPLIVASTDVVPNLNADLLDGQHASAFALNSFARSFALMGA